MLIHVTFKSEKQVKKAALKCSQF